MSRSRRQASDDHRFTLEEQRRFARTEGIERFDRVAFALRTIELLKPRGMKVAVYQGHFELRIERGREWSRSSGASWAMVSVPPDASREEIVFALAELSGMPATPWLLDILLRDPSSGRAHAAV